MALDDEEFGPQVDASMDADAQRIVSGIITLVRFSLCLLSSKQSQVIDPTSVQPPETRARQAAKQCVCGRHIVPVSNVDQLKHRLHEVRKLVEEIPPYLMPGFEFPQEDYRAGSVDTTKALQFQTMAAGIAVSSLWIQHTLLESIIACSAESGTQFDLKENSGAVDVWEVRERICSQMLQALDLLSAEAIEPNSGVIVSRPPILAITSSDFLSWHLTSESYTRLPPSVQSCWSPILSRRAVRCLPKSNYTASISERSWTI